MAIMASEKINMVIDFTVDEVYYNAIYGQAITPFDIVGPYIEFRLTNDPETLYNSLYSTYKEKGVSSLVSFDWFCQQADKIIESLLYQLMITYDRIYTFIRNAYMTLLEVKRFNKHGLMLTFVKM